ncbi:MAG: hypothetical protein Q9188_007194 [Gyalolechia gomerana]
MEPSERIYRGSGHDADGPTMYHDLETCAKYQPKIQQCKWITNVQCDCGLYDDQPVSLGTERTAPLRHYDGRISHHLPNCDQVIQQCFVARSKGLPPGEADKVWLDDFSTVEVLDPVPAYDPSTIVRDIMRADGFHPTLPPLNAHLYDLSQDRLAERPPHSKRPSAKARIRSNGRSLRRWR